MCVCVSTYILIAVLERRHAGAQVDEVVYMFCFPEKSVCLTSISKINKKDFIESYMILMNVIANCNIIQK